VRPVNVRKRSLRLLGILSDFTSLREIEERTITLAIVGKEITLIMEQLLMGVLETYSKRNFQVPTVLFARTYGP